MSEGPDLSAEPVMTPEKVAARRRQREAAEAAYRAKHGDAPLESGDVGAEKWRTPVDFQVVRREREAGPDDDGDAQADEES